MLASAAFKIKDYGPAINPSWMIAGYACDLVGCVAVFLGIFGISTRLLPASFVYLGKISYGLYVFHVAALNIEDLANARIGNIVPWVARHYVLLYPVHRAVALVLTIVAAHLSYQYFEKPFLRLKERFATVRSRSV